MNQKIFKHMQKGVFPRSHNIYFMKVSTNIVKIIIHKYKSYVFNYSSDIYELEILKYLND